MKKEKTKIENEKEMHLDVFLWMWALGPVKRGGKEITQVSFLQKKNNEKCEHKIAGGMK